MDSSGGVNEQQLMEQVQTLRSQEALQEFFQVGKVHALEAQISLFQADQLRDLPNCMCCRLSGTSASKSASQSLPAASEAVSSSAWHGVATAMLR